MSFWSNVGDFFKSNGAGIVGTVVGAIQNRKNRKAMQKENALNRQHDFDVMDYQHDINVADWNMQNAYNAPSAQMQRYQDAGLNPNLIYSQLNEGADVNSTSAQSTPGQPYQYDATIPELISHMGDNYNSMRQHRDNLKYQYDATAAQLNTQLAIAMANIAASSNSDKLKADTQKLIARWQIEANSTSQDKDLELKRDELNEVKRSNDAKIREIDYRIKHDKELSDYQIEKLRSEIQNIQQDTINKTEEYWRQVSKNKAAAIRDKVDELEAQNDLDAARAWRKVYQNRYKDLTPEEVSALKRTASAELWSLIKDAVSAFARGQGQATNNHPPSNKR